MKYKQYALYIILTHVILQNVQAMDSHETDLNDDAYAIMSVMGPVAAGSALVAYGVTEAVTWGVYKGKDLISNNWHNYLNGIQAQDQCTQTSATEDKSTKYKPVIPFKGYYKGYYYESLD